MIGLGLGITQQRRRRGAAFDPDALAYITAVETADGEALEEGVKAAINDFVVGCKADAIWDALKATCILAGARTLNGCLVPLKGAAPTNLNFVSGDYNRKTGLKGDGSTKYLDSNRNNNADPRDNNHNAVWVSTAPTIAERNLIGLGGSTRGANTLQVREIDGSQYGSRNRNNGINKVSRTAGDIFFVGASRSNNSSYTHRFRGTSSVSERSSEGPLAGNVEVFKTTGVNHTDARLSFYSIGESIDLAALDARVSTLMTALDGAIA